MHLFWRHVLKINKSIKDLRIRTEASLTCYQCNVRCTSIQVLMHSWKIEANRYENSINSFCTPLVMKIHSELSVQCKKLLALTFINFTEFEKRLNINNWNFSTIKKKYVEYFNYLLNSQLKYVATQKTQHWIMTLKYLIYRDLTEVKQQRILSNYFWF